MTLATSLLKAEHIGVRELKTHLSERLNSGKPLIVTEHGEPKQVMMPYGSIIELVEIIEELNDNEHLKDVQEAKRAIKSGSKGIGIAQSFKKIRAARK